MSLEEEIKNALKDLISDHKKTIKKHPACLVISSEEFVFRHPLQNAMKKKDAFIKQITQVLTGAGIKAGARIEIHLERAPTLRDNAFFQSGKQMAKGIFPDTTHNPIDVYAATVAIRHVFLDDDDEQLYSYISSEAEAEAEADDEPQDQASSSLYVTLAKIQAKKQSDRDLKSNASSEKDTTTGSEAPPAQSPFSRIKNLGFYGHTANAPKLPPKGDNTRPRSAPIPIIESETEHEKRLSVK